MRRPESADSSTARVAIEGARGAAANIERAGNAIAAVSAGYLSLLGCRRWLRCEVQGRFAEALARSMSPPPNAGQVVLTVLLSGEARRQAHNTLNSTTALRLDCLDEKKSSIDHLF